MNQVSHEKDAALSRISEMVSRLIQHDAFLRERLEKDDVVQIFSILLDKVSPEEIMSLDDDSLTRRVKRVMVTEAVAGTLNDLTPQEMEIFDAAVEGR